MKKIKTLPKNALVINHSGIVYQNQYGETKLIGKIPDKLEINLFIMGLEEALALPSNERVKIWGKLSAGLG